MCYEEAVVEINIHVGDDDVGVEKSTKKNEKWKMRGHQKKGEEPSRGVGKRVMVRPIISFIFG